MFVIEKILRAIREEKSSGWLFLNLRHRDKISDIILEIPENAVNTRIWVYLIRADSEPLKLVHSIESGILDHLPGDKIIYTSKEEFIKALKELANGQHRTAAQFSRDIPFISFLDHGIALLLRDCAFTLSPSGELIQRIIGTLDRKGIRSHEKAAEKLYGIVHQVWKRIEKEMKAGQSLTESNVQEWIVNLFHRHGLFSESLPLVAAGKNTADPHYMPRGSGAALKQGAVLQLDIWAKEEKSESVYADISWVGILGRKAQADIRQAFETVVQAREIGLKYIADSLKDKKRICGFEVDRHVRSHLEDKGYGRFLKHRTGHAIDSEVHGYGVNLDSVEFPDSRRLLDGSCFSIEPGVYLPDFGVRTEIDVYIKGSKPVVSGGKPQFTLLCFIGGSGGS